MAKKYNFLPMSSSHIRTRIAILDTGYDTQATFFDNSARKGRMAGWIDYVSDSARPVDDHGHGTRIVSLLMKLAPFADIFVARVAKDSAHLEDCDENIASVSFKLLCNLQLLYNALT